MFTNANICDTSIINHIEYLFEPSEFNGKIFTPTEMTKFESSFLIGLIKKMKPKKIVEIGIAARGTTLIILKALESMSSDAELYSIDKNKQYYRIEEKESGFLASEADVSTKKNWTLLTWNILPVYLEAIGKERDIDFVIIDTTHALPGELLDFIVLFPYLKKMLQLYYMIHMVIYCQSILPMQQKFS